LAEVGEGRVAEMAMEDVSAASARAMSRFTLYLLTGYVGLILVLMVAMRVTPSADVFAALAAIAAVMAGRGRAFVRDWGPFVLIFMAWEAMRGVANQFGQSVQSDSVIAVERLILGGIPTVWLQETLLVAGTVQLHDVLLSLVYVSHFFFPLAFAFLLWLHWRPMYYRFVVTLMVVSFAAFLTFVLLPVAPPRFAYMYGEALPVVDVVHEVSRQGGWQGFSWVYRNLVGNPVAAFPSMHAAYPLLVFLFLLEWRRGWALAWAPFVFIVWFATVYLGHHYVVDVAGGAVYAVGGYLLVRRLVRVRHAGI